MTLSELRWHPLLAQWVITATHRQDRTFLPPEDYCPLCPTKPGGFPTEMPADDYDIVVFENKFPSLQTPAAGAGGGGERALARCCRPAASARWCSTRPTTAPRSPPCRSGASPTWRACGGPHRSSGRAPEIEYVFIFENKGEAVGVTLHHPHGQIYAFPFVPPVSQQELEASRAHHLKHRPLPVLRHPGGGAGRRRRIVLEGDGSWPTSRSSRAIPTRSTSRPSGTWRTMADCAADDAEDLAVVLKGLLLKYDALFDRPVPVHDGHATRPRPTARPHPESPLPLRVLPAACAPPTS